MAENLMIKNMVCNRCIEAVEEEFQRVGIRPIQVQLGKVIIDNPIDKVLKEKLSIGLENRGFELLEDKITQTIEQIKSLVIDNVHRKEQHLKVNYSTYLSTNLAMDYGYLSSLFSSIEGITIEHYIILQKIEKVKELLVYDEYNLSQIANKLGYSSVQHLSNQFKKNTGMSPSQFKKSQNQGRKPLDDLK